MDDFYRELIVERYKNPAHKGIHKHSIRHFEDENPLCGDVLEIDLDIDEKGTIRDARFDGQGCAISQASADLLLESIIGKNLTEIRDLSKEDVLKLLGIDLSPARLKCALLSLKVLKGAAYGLDHLGEDAE